MIRAHLILGLLLLVICSCQPQSPTPEKDADPEGISETSETIKPEEDDKLTARNAVSWQGVYEGVVPCHDCEGIKTRIELKEDETYTISEEFLGKVDNFQHEGRIRWSKTENTLFLQTRHAEREYKVSYQELVLLNQTGSLYQGVAAHEYVLQKVD